MINTPLPTLVDEINETLTDGNKAILHQDTIRFIINDSDSKVMKLIEFMDLLETLTGQSANDFSFDVAYKSE
ncbi:hypothetical protein FO440_15505 [Mucilaginibacter corticis]|uniref:Uncharacterized protein n=1 Tax=Mucilaginibacter corticis TaxID=2597670 RepID=A0A556MH14_9SPHI|nr:hypothetical protein [Mucilaginibacter corticis]TSJ39169.1 hypothetical protein FO440_15505 [Mucilaginibacter corticis]